MGRRMKRKVGFVLVIAMLIVMIYPGTPSSASEESDGCVKENGVLTSYIGVQTEVSPGAIPSLGDGSVSAIGDSAFQGTSIAAIALPGNISSVGSHAFASCPNLVSALLPGVNTLGTGVFQGSTGMQSVTLGSAASIPDDTFNGCSGLTSITMPSAVSSIGAGAFKNCTSLASITIPGGTNAVASDAFDGCTSMTSINVEGSNGFFESIGGALYSKGGVALHRCPQGATSITIPEGTQVIKAGAFYGCRISRVTLPASVTTVELDAFTGSYIQELMITSSVSTFDEQTFQELGKIYVPADSPIVERLLEEYTREHVETDYQGNPDDPNNPGNPDDPNNPGNPDDPNNPGNPGNPDDPNNPGTPGNPDDPNNPGNSGNPDDPNNPGTPGNPDDPNNPGNSGDGSNEGTSGGTGGVGSGGTGTGQIGDGTGEDSENSGDGNTNQGGSSGGSGNTGGTGGGSTGGGTTGGTGGGSTGGGTTGGTGGGSTGGTAGGSGGGSGSGKRGENGRASTTVSEKTGIPYITGNQTISGWDAIYRYMQESASGETIYITMNGATVVPSKILALAQQKTLILVLDMGDGISWTLKGTDIVSDNLKDIDFGVTKDTGSVPEALQKDIAKESWSMQMRLAYDGIFGLTATLTIDLGKEKAEYEAVLYYYNEQEKKMEYIDRSKIATGGDAAFSFSHASDYVIVVEGFPVSGAETTVATDPDAKDDTPKTGPGLNAKYIMCLGVMLLGLYMILSSRKEECRAAA